MHILEAELFNYFFSKQCSLVNNNIKLPLVFAKEMCMSLSSVEFSTYDILKIIEILTQRGHSEKYVRRARGGLKKLTKTNKVRGDQAYLYVRSMKKIA